MKILTANRLTDGEAVWFGKDQTWVECIHDAELASDKDHEERLTVIGQAGLQANLVVDVVLIDVELANGLILPKRLREQIRANGPTNHPNFGKQARPDLQRAA